MMTASQPVLDLLGKGASLEEFARYAAQQMIALAMEAEISAAIEQYQHIKTSDGKAAVVRNGYLPERTITTTAGPLSVKVPRSRSTVPSIKPFVSALIPR